MKIPILADFSKTVANAYGVLLPGGVPLRALFIISPTGILRQITVNDLPVGRNVDEIIRLVKAFQYTDTHGEVCPANWQPGDLTMVGDPAKSKEYFKAAFSEGSSAASSAGAGGLIDVRDAGSFAAAINTTGLVVVDYWAPWCKNCKKVAPTLDRLAGELSAVKFLKVNTQDTDIGADNGVDALPTLQFFKGGKLVGEFKGSDSGAVEKAIRGYI